MDGWLSARKTHNEASIAAKKARLTELKTMYEAQKKRAKELKEEMETEKNKISVYKEENELKWVEMLESLSVLRFGDYYVMITEEGIGDDNVDIIEWLKTGNPSCRGEYTPPKEIHDEVKELNLKVTKGRMKVDVEITRTSLNRDNFRSYSVVSVCVDEVHDARCTFHDETEGADFVNSLLRAPNIDSIETDGRYSETYIDCALIHTINK